MSNSSKTVHHSQLFYWTRDNGGAWIQLQKSPTDSKYDNGTAGFATILDPDGAERFLNMEHQGIRAAFEQVPLNTPVWVEAGGKGDDAWATIKDANGNVLQDSRSMVAAGAGGPPAPPQQNAPPGGPAGYAPQSPPPPPPAQQSAPPPPPQHQQNGNGNGAEPSLAAVMYRALEAATGVMDTFSQSHPEVTGDMTADGYMERVGAMATTFFIEYQRSNGQKMLVNPSANGNG